MSQEGSDEGQWNGIIARALVYLCLQQSGLKDKTIPEKAEFLEGLGLSRQDSARMLGTTAETIRVGFAKKKKRTK